MKKEDFMSDFEEDQMMEEVPSTKKSKTADNTRETGHARECHRGARPCTPVIKGQKPAHQCTAGHAPVHGEPGRAACGFAFFDVFIPVFAAF